MPASTIPLHSPFTILVDSMEKHPFSFSGMNADADQDYREIIPVYRWHALGASNGDYSIDGHQPDTSRNPDPAAPRVSIERKSIQDCIGTILGFGERRERFQKELATLAALESAVVVVEGTMDTVFDAVEEHGRKSREDNVKTLFRSFIAYQQDYRVQWTFCDSRRLAEIYCYRWLERFHRKCSMDAKESKNR